METLLILARKTKTLLTTFEEISDKLKNYSNNIENYLEAVNDRKEELKRLQQNKYKPVKRQSTRKFKFTGLSMVSLATSLTIGVFAPEILLTTVSVGGASAAYNSKTCSDTSRRIEQLRKEIDEFEIQINSKKAVEVLHAVLKSVTIGRAKSYWKKRNIDIEELLEIMNSEDNTSTK